MTNIRLTDITTQQIASFDLTDVATKHPQALAEWKQSWKERANWMNAWANADQVAENKAYLACGKIQDRIDRLSEADQLAVLALNMRAEKEERDKGGFQFTVTPQGRRRFNRTILHMTDSDVLNDAEILLLHKARRSITPAEGETALEGGHATGSPPPMSMTPSKRLSPKP